MHTEQIKVSSMPMLKSDKNRIAGFGAIHQLKNFQLIPEADDSK